jgi:hypothetical protein
MQKGTGNRKQGTGSEKTTKIEFFLVVRGQGVNTQTVHRVISTKEKLYRDVQKATRDVCRLLLDTILPISSLIP